MDETIQRLVLSNGLRVILVPRGGTDAVTVEVLFGVGSRYEPAELSGVAHVVEHMVFKGTPRRPSFIDILRPLDAVGADYNAGTDPDYTEFHIQASADRAAMAVDILSDLLLNSLFRQEDFDTERGVIIEEARGRLDKPQDYVCDLVQSLLFPGTSLGRPIIGTVKTIAALRRQDLLDFWRAHYVPENAVVAVAGRLDEAAMLRLLEDGFGSRPFPARARGAVNLGQPVPPADALKIILRRRAEAKQARVCIGFEACGHGDSRQSALEVMGNILGGTMSSRLPVSVREKHGLAYEIETGLERYRGTSVMSVCAGLSRKKLEPAIGLIVEELVRFKSEGVTAEEVRSAQANICGLEALRFEDSSEVAEHYGLEELLCVRPQTIKESWDAIRAVTAAEVQQLAREILRTSKFRLAVVGADDDPAPFLLHAAKLGD